MALGISIYPHHNTKDEIKEYITTAAKYGYSRIFTCLLSVNGDKEAILKEFKEIINHGNSYNMETILDVSPSIFHTLGINFTDLSFFKAMGAAGVRLDIGYSGLEESIMTYNPENLKIEINMSNGTKTIDNIMSYRPNTKNLIGCHNFYPHRYTGLALEHFIKCSKQFKDLGITTAAFVNSKNANIGPWPVEEGLCTLEQHRNLPIEVQGKHLVSLGVIDDIIIANSFASEKELKGLSEIRKDMIQLRVKLEHNIPAVEKSIVLDETHFNRGDVSEYMIRSTQSRLKYSNHEFKVFNPKDIKRGDIIIESSLYGHYAGELQIALKDMDNSGRSNVVGRVVEEEIFLLDTINPWDKFSFTL